MITTTTIDPNHCEGCGTYDARCWTPQDPHGGLGCNACNRPKCRFCKGDNETTHWINCSTIPPISTTTQATTSTTTQAITSTTTQATTSTTTQATTSTTTLATTSTTSQATTPDSEDIVLKAEIEFTGSFDWSDDLSDKASDAYQEFAVEIEDFIFTIFDDILDNRGLTIGLDQILSQRLKSLFERSHP